MAHLNVRERRLEAKIAYVGPQQSGKATNFERLGGRRIIGDDDVLALDWAPGATTAFSEYQVTVRLVVPRGAPSSASVREALHEADGVVFVADADPAAHERNRASLAILRDVLASAAPRNLPVVVQVNKSDLPDALAADEVVRALDAGAWPHVTASAAKGQGVVETIERALATIFDALRASVDADGRITAPEVVTASTRRPEGNPLLSALRQVLRDTVGEHAAEIEARTSANLERMLRGFFERVEASVRQSAASEEDAATFQRSIVEDNARLREVVEALRVRTDDLVREQGASLAAVEAVTQSTAAALERMRAEIRSDLVGVHESRARTEREHLASSTTTLRRALEAVTAEMKVLDSRPSIASLRATLDVVVKTLEPVATAIRTIEPRLGQTESAVLWEVREGQARSTQRLEDDITVLRGETAGALEKTDMTAKETHRLLTEVVEELKKPKKGWFA